MYERSINEYQDSQKNVVWQYATLLYVGILIFFPNASWGLVDMGTGSDNIYYRGTGQFFLPIVTWYLMMISAVTWLLKGGRSLKTIHHNLSKQAKFFWIIFLLNFFVGITFFDVAIENLLSDKGLINIINMMLLFFTLSTLFSSKESFLLLINFIVGCVVLRGVWGLVRFVLFGGDPANFYANFQQIDIKLTFFDINDGLMAAIVLTVSAWRLMKKDYSRPVEKYFYLATCFLEVFIIAFSYRRTAWGGLALIILLFAHKNPNKIYKPIMAALFFVAIFSFGFLGTQRVENTYEGDVGVTQIFSDVLSGDDVSLSTGRFAELYAAYLSFIDSPIVGLGIWGEYDGSLFPELFWHGGDFTWMHSGIGHIALKSGVIGAALSVWVMWAFFRFFTQSFSTLKPREASVAIAGFGGFLFLLPNWLVGTPVIEYRTMQLTALTILLPYLAYSVNGRYDTN
jgi:hypothetical protein